MNAPRLGLMTPTPTDAAPRPRPRWVVGVAAAIGLALLPTAGCASSRVETACVAQGFTEPFTAVDPCSAEAVMTAATAAVFSYRPAVQVDQRAAFRVAAQLMDPALAAHGEASAVALAPISGTQWQRWAADGVAVTATATISTDDHPADTATARARVLAVTATPSGGAAPLRFTTYVRAARPNSRAGWRISALEVRS
ncbi:hypothetical protein ACWDSJ_26170 [Nocardia sp. NPDC003482]